MECNSSQTTKTGLYQKFSLRNVPIKSWWSSFVNVYSKLGFISMMIFTTLIFLLFKKPFGAIVGNALILVWIYFRFDKIRDFWEKLIGSAKSYTRDKGLQESIWFLSEGSVKITELIGNLTMQGISYCNLLDYIELPPYDVWANIAYALNKEGIKTEVTQSSFLIQWNIV